MIESIETKVTAVIRTRKIRTYSLSIRNIESTSDTDVTKLIIAAITILEVDFRQWSDMGPPTKRVTAPRTGIIEIIQVVSFSNPSESVNVENVTISPWDTGAENMKIQNSR